MSKYTQEFLNGVKEVAERLDGDAIDGIVQALVTVRENGGRVFFLGVGGGAGYASHAVNDFRKIAGIECYTPVDNVSELTARINDDGWESCFVNWLQGSRLQSKDALFVISVGGGDEAKNVSVNIVNAVKYAKEIGAKVLGVVGRQGGYTAQNADACVVVPTISDGMVTALTESFQPVIWHLLVSHPELKHSEMKWESLR